MSTFRNYNFWNDEIINISHQNEALQYFIKVILEQNWRLSDRYDD